MSELGVVVIGRNEGERLVRCLQSVAGRAGTVVYVDSGSTDGSVEAARGLGAEVVLLDPEVPFTAARARNAGLERLVELRPEVERVQFVDGDCEVVPTWLAAAGTFLDAHPDAGVVCGRRRERHPDRSVYNRLCDLEWDTPVGEAEASGGDAMMRVAPLRQVGGFRPWVVAGEEPELCLRLRAAGWKVHRIDAEMTVHDAAMTRFGQWWKRTVRCGYGVAEVARVRNEKGERIWARQTRSNWVWGLLFPLSVVAAIPFVPWAALLFLAYPLLGLRIYRSRRKRGDSPAAARAYALFCVLAKFPLALGQLMSARDRLLGRRRGLIEYKGDGVGGPLRVAYLVNQYPHVSHSFIRREIRAAEACGASVFRVSVRRPGVKLVDPGDQEEERKTHVLLGGGLPALAAALGWAAVSRPLGFARAVALAVRFGRRSGKPLRSVVYLAEACLLLRWLRRERVEHLHAHFGTNPTDVAALARALGGPPFSFTVHGPEEFDRPDAIALGEKVARAAFVVAISSYGRSQMFRWSRAADWPKVKVVRCGVDENFLRADPLPPVAEPRAVCVGRLAEQKGQLVLVAAAAKLAARGVAFELVLAGDGPMRAELEAAVAAHGLGDRVRITGWLSGDAVRAELAAARLMVLPSFAEGLPVVIMEALALGRPVVSTFVAGIPELVRDGGNGWLVPAGDPERLAEALAEGLSADVARLAEMGRAGVAAVRAAHDVRNEASVLVGLFAASVGRAAGAPESPVTAGGV